MPNLVELFDQDRLIANDGSDRPFLNQLQHSSEQNLRDFFSHRYPGNSSNSPFHLALDCEINICKTFIELNKKFARPLFDINITNGHGLTPLARLINNQKGAVEIDKICTLAQDGGNIGTKSFRSLMGNINNRKMFERNRDLFLKDKNDLEVAGLLQLISNATSTNQIAPQAIAAAPHAQQLAMDVQQHYHQ